MSSWLAMIVLSRSGSGLPRDLATFGLRGRRALCAAALVVACSGATACARPSAPAAPPPEFVPPIPLTTLAGERTDVARLAHGRAALVSLWATWCDGCDREMDSLNRVEARGAATGEPVVIGIAVGEEPAKVAAFVQRRGLRYVQLVDEDFAFADAMGERRVPATLVLDRQGRVVYRGGALDAKGLAALREASGSGVGQLD